MTTGRKRCLCGQYKIPLDNHTMPRHTKPAGAHRVRCHGTGMTLAAITAARKAG